MADWGERLKLMTDRKEGEETAGRTQIATMQSANSQCSYENPITPERCCSLILESS